jgi:hypothetical protein
MGASRRPALGKRKAIPIGLLSDRSRQLEQPFDSAEMDRIEIPKTATRRI